MLTGFLYFNKNETTPNPTAAAQIFISKDGFTPNTLTIAKNQPVIWINKDLTSHNLSMSEFEKETLNPGDSFTFIFEESGTYTYSDGTNFKGTIIIK